MDGRKGRKKFFKEGRETERGREKKERRGVRKARKSDSHCLSLRVIVLCKYLLIQLSSVQFSLPSENAVNLFRYMRLLIKLLLIIKHIFRGIEIATVSNSLTFFF